MRLFAAVVPPRSVVSDLDSVVAPVRDDALSWTLTSAWHLTLAFYGDVDEAKLPNLTRRLERAAGRSEPMTLRLAGAGRFGKAVLWVGVDGDLSPLRRLASSAVACGRRIGLTMGAERRFRPHITLARASSRQRIPTSRDDEVRTSTQRQVDLRPYAEQLRDYVGPEWTATEMTLIRSHLGQGEGGRARYETVASFPFRSPQ